MRAIGPLRELATNRPLVGLIGVTAISSVGDWLYLTALPVLVYQATGDAALVGVAAAGRLIPFFLLSMPAGIVADRIPQRSILLATGIIRILAMALMAVLTWTGGDILIILAVAMIAAAAGTFAMPAQGSLIPQLATDMAQLGRANALSSTLDGMACVLGPAIAGVLILAGGVPMAFALNGASFCAVVVVLVAVVPGVGRGGAIAAGDQPARRTAEDVSWLALIRRIGRPLALDAAISFAGAATSVLAVIIAVELLGAGEAFAGALNAGAGIGVIIGGLATGLFINRDPRRGVVFGLVLSVVALILLATTSVPGLAVGLLAATVGSLILLDTLNMTTVQRLTADGGTGRALGLLHTLAAFWMMAGSIVPALIAATLGADTAVLATAAIAAVLGGLSLVGTWTGAPRHLPAPFGAPTAA
jgi:predicted MFS family arabinose efflux permease